MKDVISNLTSPAKLAFAAYVLLLYHRSICPPPCVTVLVFVAFIALQICHDDYLRIWLNHAAEIASAKKLGEDGKVTSERLAAIKGRTANDMGLSKTYAAQANDVR